MWRQLCNILALFAVVVLLTAPRAATGISIGPRGVLLVAIGGIVGWLVWRSRRLIGYVLLGIIVIAIIRLLF